MPTGRSLVCLPLDSSQPSVGVIGLTFEAGWLPGPERDGLPHRLRRHLRAGRAPHPGRGGGRRARRRLTFLAQVSQELGGSLDYRATLTNVANLIVPELADWCAVDVVQDGAAGTVAVAHVDPEKVRWAWELQEKYPPDPDSPTGAPNVVRTGVSELYPEITDEMLVAGARDEEHLRLSRELHLRSAIVVPLSARGRTLGAITLIRTDDAARLRRVRSGVRRGSGTAGRRRDRQRAAVRADPGRRAATAARRAAGGDRRHRVLGDRHALRAGRARRGRRRLLRRDRADRRRPGLRDRRRHGPRRARGRGDGADARRRCAPICAPIPTRRHGGQQARHHVRQARDHPARDADLRRGRPARGPVELRQRRALPAACRSRRGSRPRFVHTPPRLPLGAGGDERVATTIEFSGPDTLLLFTDGLVEHRGEIIDAGLARLAEQAPVLLEGPSAAGSGSSSSPAWATRCAATTTSPRSPCGGSTPGRSAGRRADRRWCCETVRVCKSIAVTPFTVSVDRDGETTVLHLVASSTWRPCPSCAPPPSPSWTRPECTTLAFDLAELGLSRLDRNRQLGRDPRAGAEQRSAGSDPRRARLRRARARDRRAHQVVRRGRRSGVILARSRPAARCSGRCSRWALVR